MADEEQGASKEPSARSHADWDLVEIAYRAGIKTLRQIADEHGVTHGAVNKRAKTRGWTRESGVKPLTADRSVVAPQLDEVGASAGFLYVIFIECEGVRRHKVGISKTLVERLKSHQTSNPFEIRVALAYYVGDMRAEERYLHSLFHSQRIRGEWFDLTDADLKAISQRSLLT